MGRATFTLTNAWCHPFEQAEMKGNESEEVGNLWMMSTVILLDTAVCHFSLLIFTVLLTFHAYFCVYVCVCVKQIDATDVLSAMGAIPSGFRPSTLNKLLVEGQRATVMPLVLVLI